MQKDGTLRILPALSKSVLLLLYEGMEKFVQLPLLPLRVWLQCVKN